MTNEPEFPGSDGPQDSSSSSDPAEESTANSLEENPGNQIEETASDEGDLGSPPEIDDLFGADDDRQDDSVSSDSVSSDSVSSDSVSNDDVDDANTNRFDPDLSWPAGADSDADEIGSLTDGDEAGAGIPTSPPIAGPMPVARQLTRDPNSSFGGVASGLSHHFGIDVSIIRVAFIALTFVSGIGALLYALGWLVIPRAKFWPPVPRAQASASVGGRELGFVLTGLGLLILWFSVGGGAAQVFVPLVLVAGGVWFLAQPDRRLMNEPAPMGSVPLAMPPPPGAQPTVDPTVVAPAPSYASPSYGAPGYAAPVYAMPYHGAPVPPRSRTRRIFRPLVIIGVFALPVLLVVALGIGLLTLVASEGDWETTVNGVSVSSDDETLFASPSAFADIPESINSPLADVVLDLSEIDVATFDGEPTAIDINSEVGDVYVILPEDMGFAVDANMTLGSINVFDQGADGIDVSLSQNHSDPMVELTINGNIGEIIVDSDMNAFDDAFDQSKTSGFEITTREVEIDPFGD